VDIYLNLARYGGSLEMIDDERIACTDCDWNNYNFEEKETLNLGEDET
jgi:hypothetical protein